MARSRIVINSFTGSYFETTVGEAVTLHNDGEGGELTILWISNTGSQPSGTHDVFSDPTSFDPTITLNKEGSYLIHNIVDGAVTGSAIIAVKHKKSGLRSPAAGEKTEESGSYGWARAVQKIHDYLDDVASEPGLTVGLAKEALNRGDLVRPSGTLRVKVGLAGEERLMEFAKVSGEGTGSFQSTLYIVEGVGPAGSLFAPSGSTASPISGSYFTARLHGLFGPFTASATSIGSSIFARSDGVPESTLDVVDRKIGTVVDDAGAGTYWMHFDGTSDRRGESIVGINIQETGSNVVNTPHTTINHSGSGGIVVTAVDQGGGIVLVDISGTVSEAAGNTLIIQEEGSNVANTPHTTMDFSGSGGLVVTATDQGGGIVKVDVSGTISAGGGSDTPLSAAFVAGQDITAGALGPMTITNESSNANGVFRIRKDPAGSFAGYGHEVVMGTGTTGPGYSVYQSGTGPAIHIETGDFNKAAVNVTSGYIMTATGTSAQLALRIGQSDHGFYRASISQFTLRANSVSVCSFRNGGGGIGYIAMATKGSLTVPVITTTLDLKSGVYWPTDVGNIALTTNDIQAVRWDINQDQHNSAGLFLTGTLNAQGGANVTGSLTVVGQAGSNIVTLTNAGTLVTDCTLGNVFQVTMTGSMVWGAPTGMKAGFTYIWNLTQNATGAHTLDVTDTIFKFPSDPGDIVLSTASGSIDVITGVYNGLVFLCTYAKDYV